METPVKLLVTIGNLVSPPTLPFTARLRGGLDLAVEPNICRPSQEDYCPAWAALVFGSPPTGSSLNSLSALIQSSTSFPGSALRCRYSS